MIPHRTGQRLTDFDLECLANTSSADNILFDQCHDLRARVNINTIVGEDMRALLT